MQIVGFLMRRLKSLLIEQATLLGFSHNASPFEFPHEKRMLAFMETKVQIKYAVTTHLINTFNVATQIVQSLKFLKLGFQASSLFL